MAQIFVITWLTFSLTFTQEMPDFDTYLTRMGVDDTMKAIITGYMALPSDRRKTVKEYIESLADEIAQRKDAAAKPTELPADAPDVSGHIASIGKMVDPPVSDSDKPPTATESPPDGVPPGLELDPGIEDKVKKIRAKLYAQASTRRMFTTSPSTEDASENKKSRP